MTELLQMAVSTAVDAGKEIMKIYHDRVRISIKRNLTPVTNADKAANRLIIERLAVSETPVISEEASIIPYTERKQWPLCWLVDPLDGTKEFITKSKDFTVNIALIRKNIPVLGVIYAPAYETLFFAGENIGSFKISNVSEIVSVNNDISAMMVKATKLPCTRTETYTYIVSKSHINTRTRKYLKNDTRPKQFLSKGSSLKLCALAEGSADEYPRFGRTMEWDTAAGDAILQNAGGKIVSAAGGEALKYNKADLANPEFIAYRLSS
ncbi:MAG: 3'(2'),5'-bisphosphate nucleotidase CysQ [Bacteroidales bacterium]|nr:3'(2'),5'-bisphosphate nucleotidase CysQ [Bacteroidales bacterium]MDD4214919.1 3'(2'),5'-bisphosphate nucleotidase CysQ [Bacteroidales bacterium]